VILMKENHSYDNYFGVLGRGDGFTLGPDGTPLNSNPDSHGQQVRAHHLGLPFNPSFDLNQTWNDSHRQWNGGAMDGFVTTTNSNDPMGYLDGTDLPWYYGFARAYGIGDRYFSSVLAQTFPNRRFLQAGTAAGLVSTSLPNPFERPPAAGLIWDQLDAHGIGWANYVLEGSDHEWERRRLWTEGITTRPSDLFRRHIYVNFWFETAGIEQRYSIGIDNIMWESDYPHTASTYPKSWTYIEDTLKDVPEEERKKILCGNAVRLYNLD